MPPQNPSRSSRPARPRPSGSKRTEPPRPRPAPGRAGQAGGAPPAVRDGEGSEPGSRLDPRLREALDLLSQVAQERLRRHPQGHRVDASESLDLALALPLAMGRGRIEGAAEAARSALEGSLEGLIHHRSSFRPGRVLCLRCGTAECDHARLPDPRSTFAGYGPTGIPRFVDFAQWLLESRDPRLDALYTQGEPQHRKHLRTIAVTVPEEELMASLLPQYRDRVHGYRIHGQVTAGWYRVADREGIPQPMAVTFQVVSSALAAAGDDNGDGDGGQGAGPGRPSGRRLDLHLLALGPHGEPLDHLYDRLGEIPWGDAARWGRKVTASIGQALQPGGKAARASRREGPDSRAILDSIERRIEGLLGNLARRLEKDRRSKDRRTRHADEHHEGGDRPVRMALADLARAKDEDLLRDPRKETFVVLGDKGRAHVFNPDGKIVTSIRYSPHAIERRRSQGIWKPATAAQIHDLRRRVMGIEGGSPRPEASP